jgi:hypothetical protein
MCRSDPSGCIRNTLWNTPEATLSKAIQSPEGDHRALVVHSPGSVMRWTLLPLADATNTALRPGGTPGRLVKAANAMLRPSGDQLAGDPK